MHLSSSSHGIAPPLHAERLAYASQINFSWLEASLFAALSLGARPSEGPALPPSLLGPGVEVDASDAEASFDGAGVPVESPPHAARTAIEMQTKERCRRNMARARARSGPRWRDGVNTCFHAASP